MSARGEYQVLARKYRPQRFAELVGHETLVRTLTHALDSGRIAQAFMLTGVRGIGKTTTARLIARALNCIGPDGQGGPTMEPCGVCDPCQAIAGDRHPDVIEMDAASHTGVDEMRDLIDGVRYRPVSARYKVYIVDEVHMLSKHAFNALLKTLEEPPPDIKFIFATTEINKVPATILSRCQRYTLPRLSEPVLAGHFAEIARREAVTVDGDAVALIARAADGSVRDGLSILDQAIALANGAPITAKALREMLGTADRSLVLALFEMLQSGDAPAALAALGRFYDDGMDPATVIQELLDITHEVTRVKLDPSARQIAAGAERDEQARAAALAAKLGVPALTRTWQILLKGLGEVQMAPQPLKAAEMILVRLIYVADLPPPAEIVKALRDGVGTGAHPLPGSGAPIDAGGPRAAGTPRPRDFSGGQAVAAALPSDVAGTPSPRRFDDVMAMLVDRREAILHSQIARHVHLVRFEPGRIELRLEPESPPDLPARLAKFLLAETGQRWMVALSREAGLPTLQQREASELARQHALAAEHPLVKAVLETLPGSTIARVTLGDAGEPGTATMPFAGTEDAAENSVDAASFAGARDEDDGDE